MTTDSSREAFEAWALKETFDLRREVNNANEYRSVRTYDAYEGWQAATAQALRPIVSLLYPNGIKHPQQLEPEWIVDEVESRIESLQSTIDHLMACQEFKSKLQNEILKVGSKYMNIREGKTYSVLDAWAAIEKKLGDRQP